MNARRFLPVLWIFAVASALYARTLWHTFAYDDRKVIVQDVPLGWEAIRCIDDLRRAGRQATFWGEHLFWGLNPAGYHAGNVLLHALACASWGGVLLRLGIDRRTAWLSAFLLCVHPSSVEAVASPANRKEMLAMILGCTCLLAHHRWPRGAGRFGVALAWAGALACKEIMVFLPFLFPLWDRMALRGTWREGIRRALPLCLAAVAAVCLYDPLPKASLHKQFLSSPAGVRVATGVRTWCEGLLRVAWPCGFRSEYGADLPRAPWETRVLVSALALLALGSWAVRSRRPEIRWGLAWYAAHWLLVSNIPRAVAYVMADRYLYVPSAGACLVAACLLRGLGPSARPATAVLAMLLASQAYLRCADWESERRLFPTAILHHPVGNESQRGEGEARWTAYRQVGLQGEAERSRRASLRALAAYPRDGAAAVNLGNVLLVYDDNADGASSLYRQAIENGFPAAWCNLGILHLQRGDREHAREAFARFLTEGRRSVPAWQVQRIERLADSIR